MDQLFKMITDQSERDSMRRWARENWKMGASVSALWHPIVRDEIELIKSEYPALLESAENTALAAGVPSAVVDAIIKAWRDQAAEILPQLCHNKLTGHYSFNRWGMYVGVEYDGYIHT